MVEKDLFGRDLLPLFPHLKLSNCLLVVAGAAIQAVGVSNIHAFSGVTEGGVLGAVLLINYWLHITPAVTSFVLNAACYLLGWRTLGKEFIWYSLLAGAAFSVFYALCEPFAPLWPALVESPLASALLGAVFIGVGAGMGVRGGGASAGDDALAMSLSRILKWDIQWVYLFTDFSVLALSATYIPLNKLVFSLITVLLSGQIIGWMQKIPGKEKERQ